MTYAIIAVGGKQYRVREGERLLVDRLAEEEGKTFKPEILLLGGDGDPKLGDELDGAEVTALVAGHVLGKKLVVGKHRKRTGYRRRKGHRSRLTQIEIQAIGAKSTRKAPAKKAEPAEKKAPSRGKAERAKAKPAEKKAAEKKKPAARKPAAKTAAAKPKKAAAKKPAAKKTAAKKREGKDE